MERTRTSRQLAAFMVGVHAFFGQRDREPKVQEDDLLSQETDVVRFEVAMEHDALRNSLARVQVVHRGGELATHS